MSRAVAVLFLALATGEVAPAPVGVTGYASAYADGVMDATIAWRNATGTWRTPPPRDWYTAHGAIATNDCAQVGQMMTLVTADGREWRVLVADCAGRDSAGWMTENSIVAELDWDLFTRLTGEHGRPLEVTIR